MKLKSISALLLTILLSGCITRPATKNDSPFETSYPQLTEIEPASAGSIYQAQATGFLFTDRRAFRVGDVVTIHLEEETASSKSAGTSLKKGTENQIVNPVILGNLIRGHTETDLNTLESGSEFVGEAESDQRNSLRGTLTAIVAEVVGNGLLRVQGEKRLTLNRGEEYLRVSGLVRVEDIDGANNVSSLRLANARIAYSGTGELADTNSAGWLSRFFLSPLFPF